MISCKMILLWLFASFKNVWELVFLVDPVNPNLSIYGALQNFDYALDYKLSTTIIALGLFVGIFKFCNWFKTSIYLLSTITIFGFLMILFLGYLLLLNEENKFIEIIFEYGSLINIAIFGMLIFFGFAIEAFTFYTLVSLKQKNIFSAKGALKYFFFLIGAGMIILGISLLYGQMAKTNFIEISELFPNELKFYGISLGGLLLISGLLFEIGAAPFYLLFTLNNIFQSYVVVFFASIASAIIGSVQAVVQAVIKFIRGIYVLFSHWRRDNKFFQQLFFCSLPGVKTLRLLSVLPIISITPENSWMVETGVVAVVGVVFMGLFVIIAFPVFVFPEKSLEDQITSWESHLWFLEYEMKFYKYLAGDKAELEFVESLAQSIANAEQNIVRLKIILEKVKAWEALFESIRQRLNNQETNFTENDSDSDSAWAPDPDDSSLPGDFFLSIYKIFAKEDVKPLTAEKLHTDLQSFNGDLTGIISYINELMLQNIPMTPEAVNYVRQFYYSQALIKSYIKTILETPFMAPQLFHDNINLLVENFHFFIT